jgi:hypothetical protein
MTDAWERFAESGETSETEPAIARATAEYRWVATVVLLSSIGLIAAFVLTAVLSWSVSGLAVASAILAMPLPVVVWWAGGLFKDVDVSRNAKHVLDGGALSAAAKAVGLPTQLGWIQAVATAVLLSGWAALLISFWV